MRATDQSVMVAEAALTLADVKDLTKLESSIASWRKSYLAAGRSLRQVADRRLWRGTFASFPDYLAARWDLQYANAWRIMSAADVAGIIEAAGLELPANAGQAIELSGLEAEQIVAIWGDVCKAVGRGGRLCSDLVKSTKRKHLGAVADVAPDGSIDEDLAELLRSGVLPPEEQAAVVRASEERTAAHADGGGKVRPEWAEVLKEIKSGLRRLEHDQGHRQQFREVLALLRRVCKLLHTGTRQPA